MLTRMRRFPAYVQQQQMFPRYVSRALTYLQPTSTVSVAMEKSPLVASSGPHGWPVDGPRSLFVVS